MSGLDKLITSMDERINDNAADAAFFPEELTLEIMGHEWLTMKDALAEAREERDQMHRLATFNAEQWSAALLQLEATREELRRQSRAYGLMVVELRQANETTRRLSEDLEAAHNHHAEVEEITNQAAQTYIAELAEAREELRVTKKRMEAFGRLLDEDREELKGPNGYATWEEAAIDERIKRVAAEKELRQEKDRAENWEKDATALMRLQKPLRVERDEARAQVKMWRNDALEKAALIADAYEQADIARDIRALLAAPAPAETQPSLSSSETVAEAQAGVPEEEAIGLAHEIWAAAQLMPNEGIVDGVSRIADLIGMLAAAPAQKEGNDAKA